MKDVLIFEWDDDKNEYNVYAHGISFDDAKKAFSDKRRVVVIDEKHSAKEERFFCFAKIADPSTGKKRVVTVRFTLRQNVIRIFGAGFWRKGRAVYEKENET